MINARRRWNVTGILAALALFVAIGLTPTFTGPGDDLSSSYVACRLLASGQSAALYSYDPVNFPDIGDDENDTWQIVANQAHFDGSLHPYVQTPLWAWALQPLCTRTSFPTFNRLFQVLALLAFAASIWLVARFWTPSLFNPFTIGIVVLALLFSQPFAYAVFLNQTHVFFFLAIIAGLILAERDRPIAAGLLLALAAAVKITPAALLVYWLLTRRYKAAASMAVWTVLLTLITLLTTGKPLFTAYLADLHRVSRVLLVGINNQSFAAWWMGRVYPAEILRYHILPLPDGLRIASAALLLVGTVAGGLLDRQRAAAAPFGAMIALVAATLFAPIAWTHYSVILVAPLMLIAQIACRSPRPRAAFIFGLIAVMVALNFPPLSTDVIAMELGRFAILRAQFCAGTLCLAALAVLARYETAGDIR